MKEVSSCSLCSWHRAIKIVRNISPANQSISALRRSIYAAAMNASTRLISNKYKERISSSPPPSFRLYRVPRRISVARGLDITPVVHASYRDYPRYSNKFSLLPVPVLFIPPSRRASTLYIPLYPPPWKQFEYARYTRQICEGLRRTPRTHERQSARISSSNLFYRFCWE